jgi:hypothetical protein
MAIGSPPVARQEVARVPLALGVVVVFLAVALVYWGTARLLGMTGHQPYAYFPELAAAFLEGRLWITPPPWRMDLTLHDGRWYVPFPPLPAVLLLPWVALAGPVGVDTVLFSTGLAAGAATLVFLVLELMARHRWTQLDVVDNALLTVLFAFGSVQWVVALSGAVWHLGQETAVLFFALATALAAGGRSPFLVGGALALAALARPHLALGLPLLVGFTLQRYVDHGGALSSTQAIGHLARWTARAGVPLVGAGIVLLAYNVARFGSPLDFGYTRQVLYDQHATKLASDGWFNVRYLPENLSAMLFALPKWEDGRLVPDWNGMSLLLTSPALALAVRARRPAPIVLGAWLAVALVLVPLLSYYNTGYKQFGYRFSLDFQTPAIVLLAMAFGRRIGPFGGLLIGLGVVVNAWGVVTVYRG